MANCNIVQKMRQVCVTIGEHLWLSDLQCYVTTLGNVRKTTDKVAACLRHLYVKCDALTLIVLGEVKVDLANFNFKLPTK